MKDEIIDFLAGELDMEGNVEFEFRELYGFTFVFQKWFLSYEENFSSAEIKPVGIIYEENGEYYLAPLGKADNIHEIVREYVNKFIQVEEEHLPFQQ